MAQISVPNLGLLKNGFSRNSSLKPKIGNLPRKINIAFLDWSEPIDHSNVSQSTLTESVFENVAAAYAAGSLTHPTVTADRLSSFATRHRVWSIKLA